MLTTLFREIKPMFVLYAFLALGITLTLSAFYIEYGLGAKPCEMCWWQRYTHWAIWSVALAGVALQRVVSPKVVIALLGAIVLVSGGIGYFQGLGQLGLVELPTSCTGSGAPLAAAGNLLEALMTEPAPSMPSCAEVNFAVFGVSLAWWNAILMTVTASVLLAWTALKK